MSRTLYPIHVEPISTDRETVTESRWHQPFSEPVRSKKGLAVALIVASGVVVALMQPNTASADKWHRPFSEPVRFKQGLDARYQQTLVSPVFVPSAETITLDKWLYQWATPVRSKPGLATQLQPSIARPIAPTTGAGDVLFVDTDISVHYPKAIFYQSIADPIRVASTETITVDKWFRLFSEPQRKKQAVAQQQDSASPIAPITGSGDIIFAQTSTFVPYRTAILYQSVADTINTTAQPETISLDKWFKWLSEPSRRKVVLDRGGISAPLTQPTETVTADKWFNPFSEPRRNKPSVAQQQSSAFVKGDPFPETTYYAKWGYALSEPVRLKSGLGAALQSTRTEPIVIAAADVVVSQTITFVPYRVSILYPSITAPVVAAPEVVTADRWFNPFSESKRYKRSITPRQQDIAFVKAAPFGETITPDKWYQDFSKPVKLWLRSYKAALSPYSFQSNYLVPAPYVDPPMASWSYGFSLPVRVRTSVSIASQSGSATVMPILPQPNPPPPPGVYTVSGLYVIDQFTDNTVVYDYDGRVSHRTN